MKVVPDYDACEANAVCAGLVPEVFEVDDDDNLFILVDEVPEQLIEGVRHAVRSCRKAARRASGVSWSSSHEAKRTVTMLG